MSAKFGLIEYDTLENGGAPVGIDAVSGVTGMELYTESSWRGEGEVPEADDVADVRVALGVAVAGVVDVAGFVMGMAGGFALGFVAAGSTTTLGAVQLRECDVERPSREGGYCCW